METSYDVRIWKVEVYRGTRRTSYTVRWSVAGKPRGQTFKTAALADAFRSDLVAAARRVRRSARSPAGRCRWSGRSAG